MLKTKKKIFLIMCIVFLFLIVLIGRLFYLQFIKSDYLIEKAREQQNSERYIIAARGTIYDRTENNILAKSYTVETVSVSPMNISKENKEKVAKALSEIFELDYEKVLKKVNRKTSIETIIRRVEKEKTNKLREWMNENGIYSGINIDEDTKRYYPYKTLASHIIGFCGSDNQGLEGIEAKYEKYLAGNNGEIKKQVNAKGIDIENESEEFIKPNKGNDLVLTIDMNIQSIVEKYLENACIDNECTDGGSIIIMEPSSGDILAMANYPSYDLNDSFTINREELKNMWPLLSQEEKSKNLLNMWRNKAISDTY